MARKALAPDVLFICSYLDDSIRVVRAISQRAYAPKLVGGSVIGPQSAVVKTTLGPLLNGFVNYEYWLPVPKMMFAGAREFMAAYQSQLYAVYPGEGSVSPKLRSILEIIEKTLASAKLRRVRRATKLYLPRARVTLVPSTKTL